MSTVDKLTGKRCDKGLRCACFVSPQRTQRFTENFLCLSRRVIFKLCVTLCPLWCILFSGCDRRELTYSDEAEITLTADWSKAGLSEQEAQYGATAVFYPTDGSTPITVLMGDRSRKTVRMKEGCYNVVLFNRSFDDFSGIAFRGMDAHHTLEAYAKNAQVKGMDGGKVSMDSPDELAADYVEGFEVTPDMLGNYEPSATRNTEHPSPCQLCFTPPEVDQGDNRHHPYQGDEQYPHCHLYAERCAGVRISCFRQGFGTYLVAAVRTCPSRLPARFEDRRYNECHVQRVWL